MMEKHPIKPILEHYGADNLHDNRMGWVKVRCPFHDDSHASAAANFQENYFKCFACNMAGDTYAIIMNKEGVDFREALVLAETIVGGSDQSLSGKYSSRRGLSGRSRNQSSGRKYVPPRGRRTSTT